MKIKSILLTNFRQFLGTQELRFADDNKNITIIFGENGKGKTGIFRAMMFGLFGESYISQDDQKNKVHLVNLNLVENSGGKPVEAKVEIVFEDKNKEYNISRIVTALKTNDSIYERPGKVSLSIYDKNTGNSRTVSEDVIDAEINRVLDKNIREFFFFDAEKIDTLSSTQNKVKEVVKQGIIKVLQIDLIESGIKHLNKTIDKLRTEMSRASNNSELFKYIEKQNQLKTEILNLESENTFIEENLYKLNQELSEIQDKLNENAEIHEINVQIREKEKQVSSILDQASQLSNNICKSEIRDFHQLIMEDTYVKVNGDLSLKLKDSKSFIPKQLLEMTLEHNECFLCKSDLTHLEDVKTEIRKMINEYNPSEIVTTILLINNSISEFEMNSSRKKDFLTNAISEYEDLIKKKNEIEKDINLLENNAHSIAAKELNFEELEKSKDIKISDKEKISNQLIINQKDIERKDKEVQNLEKFITIEQTKQEGLVLEGLKISKLQDLKNKLDEISKNYCDLMRHQLMDETTKIFKLLIDEKDIDVIRKININEKYEIEVFGWNGDKITQDISQGQRQMVSLSFISALAKYAAGNDNVIDFPLFMDTPFGRVSGKNRDNLIRNMPDFTSQWILLFTDTELTYTEENLFKKYGKLGKSYKLNQLSEGNTQVIEINSNEFLATR